MDDEARPVGPAPATVAVLGEDECWDFLCTREVGRIAVSVAGVPDIYPVNYAVDARTILFRTAPGTKLLEVAANQYVAFEVDRWNLGEGVSVVIRGIAEILEAPTELELTAGQRVRPWVPGTKERLVRIRPQYIAGRRLPLPGRGEGAR